MEQENIEIKRKRLGFRAWHRGTREMDLIMGSFADQYLSEFGDTELSQFDDLLQENDPDLYNWICGRETPPANLVNPVVEKLLSHQFKN